MRAALVLPTTAIQAVGIDEWAWWHGHSYGTILFDLTLHRVVDLMSERSTTTVAACLAQYPTVTVTCCDRSGLHADGFLRGAPDAVQVVDNFPWVVTFARR